jgi:LCP family protein required for cell wall assembly
LIADKKVLFRYILLPIVLLAVLIVGGAGLWKYAQDPLHALLSDEDWRICFEGDTVNIALLGFDRNEAREKRYRIFRPDTIMIAAINLRGSPSVSLVNIPRDSYVKIHVTGGYDKINHSYMYGYDQPGAEDRHRSGMDSVLKTIEDFLGGVPVHYYVSVDMDGAAGIVDHLGGFYYNVDLVVRADMGRGRLLLKKGYQHLNGKDFLRYVRYRGTGGDLGRTQRQQKILIEAFRQLRRQGRLSELPSLYRTVRENVETDLSLRQIAALALLGAQIDPEEIKSYAFSGEMQYAPRGKIDALNYWVIDEKDRVRLIREVFGKRVALLPQQALPGPRKKAEPSKTPRGSTPPKKSSPPQKPLPSDHRQRVR